MDLSYSRMTASGGLPELFEQVMSSVFAAESVQPAKLRIAPLFIELQCLKAERIKVRMLATSSTCLFLGGVHDFRPQVLAAMRRTDPKERDVEITPLGFPGKSADNASGFIPDKNAKAPGIFLGECRVIFTSLSNYRRLVLFARMVRNLELHNRPFLDQAAVGIPTDFVWILALLHCNERPRPIPFLAHRDVAT